MREDDGHQPTAPVVAGPPLTQQLEVALAPMDLTVGEAILEAAGQNSGVPAQRATDGGSAAPGQSGPPGRWQARVAEPVCRDDHGRPAAGRPATEAVRSHA
jgi:hypothetical protein